jgi:hypothetical protein
VGVGWQGRGRTCVGRDRQRGLGWDRIEKSRNVMNDTWRWGRVVVTILSPLFR